DALEGASPAVRAGAQDVLRTVALTNEAVPDQQHAGHLQGDAVDVAFALAALRSGAVTEEERSHPPLADLPYEPHLRLSQTVRTAHDGSRVLHVKSSPDVLVGISTRMAGPDGPVPLDPGLVEEVNERMAREGLRVIATARRV